MVGILAGAALRALDLIVHETDHQSNEDRQHIQTVLRDVVEDNQRTMSICNDIAAAAASGGNSLVLTRWTEHLDQIVATLQQGGHEPLVLHGGIGKKARAAVTAQLTDAPTDGGLLLVATASLLGEGFDCPPLDTLFLAFPIRFRGNIVQYVGRILRPTPTKTRVVVHDYVDVHVPVLTRMHDERRRAYASLGFDLPVAPSRKRRSVDAF